MDEKKITCSMEEALNQKEVIDVVYKDVLALAKENALNGLEKPKQIKLLKEPFTVESDLLTPTFKLKRNIAKERFSKVIEELYAAGPYKV